MKCNLVRIPDEYKDKDGKKHNTNNFYIVFENGEYIAIQPKWTKDTNDFVRLRAFSDLGERKNKESE